MPPILFEIHIGIFTLAAVQQGMKISSLIKAIFIKRAPDILY
jgi:hypothetical protein